MSDKADVKLNPWNPMTDPVDNKTIGKFLEELGEMVEVHGRLIAAASRCFIQGIEESEPVTGVKNKTWLENEMADITAGMILMTEQFELDQARMNQRTLAKYRRLKEWHKMPDSRGQKQI